MVFNAVPSFYPLFEVEIYMNMMSVFLCPPQVSNNCSIEEFVIYGCECDLKIECCLKIRSIFDLDQINKLTIEIGLNLNWAKRRLDRANSRSNKNLCLYVWMYSHFTYAFSCEYMYTCIYKFWCVIKFQFTLLVSSFLFFDMFFSFPLYFCSPPSLPHFGFIYTSLSLQLHGQWLCGAFKKF